MAESYEKIGLYIMMKMNRNRRTWLKIGSYEVGSKLYWNKLSNMVRTRAAGSHELALKMYGRGKW